MDEEKVIANATTDAAGKMAGDVAPKISRAMKTASWVVGGAIAAGTLLYTGMKIQDKEREKKQVRIARHSTRGQSFDPDLYYELSRLSGLPQELYNNRTGHSNSWGGNKY